MIYLKNYIENLDISKMHHHHSKNFKIVLNVKQKKTLKNQVFSSYRIENGIIDLLRYFLLYYIKERQMREYHQFVRELLEEKKKKEAVS